MLADVELTNGATMAMACNHWMLYRMLNSFTEPCGTCGKSWEALIMVNIEKEVATNRNPAPYTLPPGLVQVTKVKAPLPLGAREGKLEGNWRYGNYHLKF